MEDYLCASPIKWEKLTSGWAISQLIVSAHFCGGRDCLFAVLKEETIYVNNSFAQNVREKKSLGSGGNRTGGGSGQLSSGSVRQLFAEYIATLFLYTANWPHSYIIHSNYIQYSRNSFHTGQWPQSSACALTKNWLMGMSFLHSLLRIESLWNVQHKEQLFTRFSRTT